MKLKGSVEIQVRDSRTGELKQTIKKNNTITNRALVETLGWVPAGVGNRNISISTQTTQPSIHANTLTKIIATGYTPSGITSPIFYSANNPPFGQIQKRIDFVGVERIFNTVGLTSSGNSNSQNNETHNVYAYVLLDTPCTQGAYDYLDIFYRIQFFNTDGSGFIAKATSDFGQAFMGLSGMNMGRLYTSVCKFPASPYTDIYYGDDVGFERTNSDRLYGWTRHAIISSHFKYKMGARWGLDGESIGTDLFGSSATNNIQGWLFNIMLQGARNDGKGVYTHSRFNAGESPFQNLFSHSPDATVPFFDSLKLASGNGKVLLGGTWENKFPELYKITIVADGATGVATYKWAVRRHLGFNGNAYRDRFVACPFRNPITPAFEKCHGWRDENNDVLRYSATQVVQYDDTGVTLLDVMDGAYTNWDSTTTPALPVTQARQCTTDGSKIYVGCRATGLWIIDVTSNTITNPVTAPVYGVDVGRGGVVYAIANGALSCSTDWATPLNFTYAGITDGNWSRVQFLKCDPEHAEDRMALVMTVPNSSNRRVVWWSVTDPAPVTKQLNFSSLGDANGVCYFLGSNFDQGGWINPHDTGTVTCVMSSVGTGIASYLVNRVGGQDIYTNNVANSWMSIDLGANNRLIPTSYILRLRGDYDGHAIRNWKLQGSNNAASNSVADLNAATWTDLDVRVNDTTMAYTADSWGAYTVSGVSAEYRWLRILQTGVNSNGVNHLILGEFEFYGQFRTINGPYSNPATGVEGTALKPWSASLDVSDTTGFWACGAGRLNYGLSTIAGLGTTLASQQLTHSLHGSDRYYKISFYKNWLIGQSQAINTSGTVQSSYTSFEDKAFILHMDGGIVLTNREMRLLITNNGNLVWDHYGWNGTTWELNHAGAKTTHITDQPLLNGITARFEDGANAPHWVATDFYTQAVCNGLLKDNATTIYHESAWYSKPAQFDHPVQSGLTVPAAITAPTNTRYWRIKNLVPATGNDKQWYVREVIFRDSAGNDITTGGTVAVSSVDNNNPPSRAVDKNTGTSAKVSASNTLGWISYTFASSVEVTSVSICQYNDTHYNVPPTSYAVETSTDGLSWEILWRFSTGTADNTYYNSSLTTPEQIYRVTLSAASDPDFVRIETNSVELTKLTLNGQPVTTTYIGNAIPPGPNEVVINAFGNGTVEFNSADVGKTIGGTYAWIKN